MADSLREALVTAMNEAGDSHEEKPLETGQIAQNPQNVQEGEMSPLVDERVNETASEKADRLRDGAGRFAKGKVEAPPVVEEVKPPSSWKKEYWDHYKALSPEVRAYINTREEQFASGVSTYKQEAERAKEIFTALSPYSEDLQRYNITFPQWIQQVGTVHQTLAKGTPEQKLQVLSQLLPSYNVPARLAIQDAQGQWQLLDPRQLPQQHPQQQQQFQPQDIEKLVEQKLEQRTLSAEIQEFAKSHPHYEAVRSQMAGLLQTGMAENLDDAYDKALRINPALWEAEQQRLTQEKAEQARQAQAARVTKARSNAVSPRSDTPSGSMTGEGKKGLRSNLEDAFSAIEEGRV